MFQKMFKYVFFPFITYKLLKIADNTIQWRQGFTLPGLPLAVLCLLPIWAQQWWSCQVCQCQGSPSWWWWCGWVTSSLGCSSFLQRSETEELGRPTKQPTKKIRIRHFRCIKQTFLFLYLHHIYSLSQWYALQPSYILDWYIMTLTQYCKWESFGHFLAHLWFQLGGPT